MMYFPEEWGEPFCLLLDLIPSLDRIKPGGMNGLNLKPKQTFYLLVIDVESFYLLLLARLISDYFCYGYFRGDLHNAVDS